MPLVPTDDYLVDNTHLNRCLAVDREARTITVECGMRLKELTDIAEKNGMMLPSPTVATNFTVGGMVATGSAGTGMQTRTFSDAVVGLTIVRADGSVVEMTADDPDLPAARVSFGTLGIFYALTFQCLPAENMLNVDQVVPLAQVLRELPQLVRQHYGVLLMWYPYTDQAWLKLYDPTPGVTSTYGRWTRWLYRELQYAVEGGLARIGQVLLRLWPSLTPAFMALAMKTTRNTDYIETPRRTFHFQFVYPPCWDSSWAIPVDQAEDAWHAWIDTINEFRTRGIYPINLVVASRFTRQSTSLLSPDYCRDSCFIEATTFKDTAGVQEFYQAIETIMIERFNGRPHWAKMWYGMERVQQQYRQQLEQFAAVRQRWDPDGMFLNDFLERLFAVSRAHPVPPP